MKYIAKQIIIGLTLLVMVLPAASQSTIKLHATTDKKKILLGEQMILTLKADWPAKTNVSFFEIDTIPHFEILSVKKADTVLTANGISITQQFVLTSFDSGSFIIPSFRVSGNRNMVTPAIKIEVAYTDSFDPNAEYHGFKDVMPAEDAATDNYSWLYLAGAGLLILILLLYIYQKEKVVAPKITAVTDANAYDHAMQQLEVLKQKTSDPKLFFTGLTQIFREYLYSSKGIYSMQKTTDDLVLQLRAIPAREIQYNELAQALRLSDFVKFAKYIPATGEMNEAWAIIKNNIELLEKTETTTA